MTFRIRHSFLAAVAAAVAAGLALGGTPAGAHSGHDHGAAAEAPAEIRVGDLVLTEAFSRATRPGAPVAGGFLLIANEGAADDRLVAARSDIAGHMEIHEMAMADGVMKMRELPDGLAIPAGETVALKPGGYHVMFMDLKGPLVEGETVTVTLVFEKAGEVTLPLAILGPDARSFEVAS